MPIRIYERRHFVITIKLYLSIDLGNVKKYIEHLYDIR